MKNVQKLSTSKKVSLNLLTIILLVLSIESHAPDASHKPTDWASSWNGKTSKQRVLLSFPLRMFHTLMTSEIFTTVVYATPKCDTVLNTHDILEDDAGGVKHKYENLTFFSANSNAKEAKGKTTPSFHLRFSSLVLFSFDS